MENFFSDNKSLKFHLNHPLMEKIIRIKENDFYEKDQYDYAPQDVEDALENYEKVLEIIGEIASEIIATNAEIVDAEGPQLINNEVHYHPATQENYNALVEANVMGLTLPRQYQGLNFPILPFVMSNEIIARADASFS
ncbi:MAG TPA: acyl-CoA dehydrogenase, partial [Bacteroidales bacterium]|nr:acyl-CoA dehydrogenase [Bacteroidales bacterium]